MCEHWFDKKNVSSCSTAPSCGRNISTMLAQKCKNGAAGCYRAMTAKEGMSHQLLEASQHSRSRNYDRKSDSQSQEQPEGAGGSQKEPGGAQSPHRHIWLDGDTVLLFQLCCLISSSSRSNSRSSSSSIVVVVVVVVEDEDPAEFHSRLPAAFLAQQLLPIFEVPSFLPAQTLSNVTSQIVTAPTNFAKPCAFLASQAAAFLQRPTLRRHSVRE